MEMDGSLGVMVICLASEAVTGLTFSGALRNNLLETVVHTV